MRALGVSRIAIGFAALVAFVVPAAAATETVLYSFSNAGTGYPSGSLYLRNGSLYGTAAGDGRTGDGQVFRLTHTRGAWKEKTLGTFAGANGATPFAGLVRDSNGVMYGTTWAGGAQNAGTVFSLEKSGGTWITSTIWTFGGTSGDGTQPTCDLAIDKSGNLYGTTSYGGADGAGTVFELSNVNGAWTETILYSFTGQNGDGWEPYAGLLIDGSGTLYGTTRYGGERGGDGTVFKVYQSRGLWSLKIIYSFSGSDGSEPLGTLIRDKSGALYGTTYAGGAPNVGTVFKLSRSGGKWTETVLHTFNFDNGDGYNPFAGLRWSQSGSLYGTTSEGGSPGGGTVFELAPGGRGGAWTETILHGFGVGDGIYPQGGVTLDQNGALYGTTEAGGTDNLGTVWTINP